MDRKWTGNGQGEGNGQEIARKEMDRGSKEHLQNNISLETLIVLNKILGYKKDFDKKLSDPVWKFLSMRVEKYNAFINIDVFKFKKILKEIVSK